MLVNSYNRKFQKIRFIDSKPRVIYNKKVVIR